MESRSDNQRETWIFAVDNLAELGVEKREMIKIDPGGVLRVSGLICRHPRLVMEYDRTWPGRGHIVLAGWKGS